MCGIAGKLTFSGHVDEQVLRRMAAQLEHRGPDSEGVHLEPGVGLAIRRLAIIDVEGGDQPIYNEDRSVVVVMNGEIYNFQTLRADLEQRGHRFATGTDTEVLVHLYEQYGTDLVNHLHGMFAFALWDRRRRRLICARDRVGKKPLYWARHGESFWFASEMRALIEDPEVSRDVDPEAIDAYLSLGYVPHPLSAFRDVKKLPPATVMTITDEGTSMHRYWSLAYEPKFADVPARELEERFREHLDSAVHRRLISDVPLGAFLSGGIDSSAVVASMAKQTSGAVKTFSIGFSDKDFDELRYARLVAERFATDHHELVVEPDAVAILPKVARQYGEPFADSSAIPSFYLSEMTRRHVTVALNGDGGDESFAGYPRYLVNRAASGFDALPLAVRRPLARLGEISGGRANQSSRRNRLRRLATTAAVDAPERYAMWVAPFSAEERTRLLAPGFFDAGASRPSLPAVRWRESQAVNHIDRMLDVDVATYLPDDLLAKVDIATMAYSLEARSPLLDHELMGFAARLPANVKLRGRESKWLMKRALEGVLPHEVLHRPKMGFNVPLARWLRTELRELAPSLLLDPQATGRGWFRPEEVERLTREHLDGTADHAQRLWVLLQLELWNREVAEAIPAQR